MDVCGAPVRSWLWPLPAAGGCFPAVILGSTSRRQPGAVTAPGCWLIFCLCTQKGVGDGEALCSLVLVRVVDG